MLVGHGDLCGLRARDDDGGLVHGDNAAHRETCRSPMARHRRSGDGRCGDCGVEPGGYHHLGCDLARCPRCARQLITCGCPFDELDDGEGFDDIDEGDDFDELRLQRRTRRADGVPGIGGMSADHDPCGGRRRPRDGDGPWQCGARLPWRQACPRCGSAAVIPILYGIRNPTSAALEAHGVLELGESTDPERPTSRCKECEHGWTPGPSIRLSILRFGPPVGPSVPGRSSTSRRSGLHDLFRWADVVLARRCQVRCRPVCRVRSCWSGMRKRWCWRGRCSGSMVVGGVSWG